MQISSQARRTLAGVLTVAAAVLAGPAVALADGTHAAVPASAQPAARGAARPPAPATVTRRPAVAPSFAQTICFGPTSDETIIPWYGAPVSAGQAVVVSATEQNGGGGEFIGDAHASERYSKPD
jgi:hypothetical protein